MIGLIETIQATGSWSLIMGICAVILIIPVGIKAWKEFVSSIGLVSKSELKEEKKETDMEFIRNQLTDISGRFDKMDEKLDDLEERLGNVQAENDLRRIADLKIDISNFASRIGHVDYIAEDYDHIFELNKEYHKLLDRHKMSNKKIDRAMAKVRVAYDKMIELEAADIAKKVEVSHDGV